MPKLLAILADAGISDPDILHPYPGQVSEGQLQRICLARALAQRPTLLLCDEPTAQLDPIATARTTETITRYIEADPAGRGALIVSHDAQFLHRTCTTVFTLADGTLHTAAPSEA